jgi:hypothetical protein
MEVANSHLCTLQYTELRPGEFRLLNIKSWPEAGAVCELTAYPLEKAPKWIALSYVWGNEEAGQDITVNNQPFKVRPNLLAALRTFFDCEELIGYALWIDAICINQDDVSEKESQIPMMSSIYSQAEAVTVWLTKACGHGRLAVEVLLAMAEVNCNLRFERENQVVDRRTEVRMLAALETKHSVMKSHLLALLSMVAYFKNEPDPADEDERTRICGNPFLFQAGHPF